jgi:hypothetical protein
MSAAILAPLLVNLAAFALLYAYFVAKRVHLLQREQHVEEGSGEPSQGAPSPGVPIP